eukprot:6178626-Pleurochrysis_carterae.AAC.1
MACLSAGDKCSLIIETAIFHSSLQERKPPCSWPAKFQPWLDFVPRPDCHYLPIEIKGEAFACCKQKLRLCLETNAARYSGRDVGGSPNPLPDTPRVTTHSLSTPCSYP